jgi:hypothetical protein
MAKRPQIKGNGSDGVLGPPPAAQRLPAPQTPQHTDPQDGQTRERGEKRVMVTMYLPPALVDKLDRAWVARRLRDRKVQKSHIVTEALEAYLQDVL